MIKPIQPIATIEQGDIAKPSNSLKSDQSLTSFLLLTVFFFFKQIHLKNRHCCFLSAESTTTKNNTLLKYHLTKTQALINKTSLNDTYLPGLMILYLPTLLKSTIVDPARPDGSKPPS